MESPAATSYWGAQTSYLNFCEEDYVVTRYIAEFVNTLSSLVYVAYGLYGLLHSNGGRRRSAASLVPYCGLIGVGVCSASYHMTLKYHTQMSDELSMHLLTTPLLYRILTFKASPVYTNVVGAILLVLFIIVMVAHMVMDEFLLHATAFASSVLLITFGMMRIIPQQVSDLAIRENLKSISRFGLVSFVFGYIVWLLDDLACRLLTDMRHTVGLPLAFLFEFHGWWHIFTAMGGYSAIAVVDVITSGEVHDDPTDSLAWPVPFASRLLPGAKVPSKKD